jgi:hypothetical protein
MAVEIMAIKKYNPQTCAILFHVSAFSILFLSYM